MKKLGLAFALAIALAGCGSPADESSTESVSVFAADPLKQALTDISERFKTDNPGSEVELTFGNSSDLVLQLAEGAEAPQPSKADVFASVDRNDMVKAEQAELVDGKPTYVADAYSVAVLTGAANPDLARKFVDLVTGDYGRKVLSEAGFGPP